VSGATMPVADKLETYLAEHERLAAASEGPSWLRDLRREAIAQFAALGFPSARDEDWRFTSVGPLVERPFGLAGDGLARVAADQLGGIAFGEPAGGRLVFVNGRFAPDLSSAGTMPGGVRVGDLRSALERAGEDLEPHLGRIAGHAVHAFTALNTAFLTDGAVVWVPAGAVAEAPIHLLFVSAPGDAPAVSHPRVLIVAGEHSQSRVIETYAGLGDARYWTNAVTEVLVEPHAIVDHYKLQQEGTGGLHMASMHVRSGRSSTFSSHSLALGGAWVRNEVVAALGGEGGDTTLNGIYVADGDGLIDNHTTIDHATPHNGSHEVYKGILAGRARAVFNGKIIVRPDAQKTDAKQTNKALLLSDEATINTKPQLEIFANDVRCTHGAAIGQLDEDALFYLRSRGFGYEQARNLLVEAFAGEILDRVKLQPLRAAVERALLVRLPGRAR